MSDKAILALQELYKFVLGQQKMPPLQKAFSSPLEREMKCLVMDIHREVKRLYRLHAGPIAHLPGTTSSTPIPKESKKDAYKYTEGRTFVGGYIKDTGR